MSEEDEELQAQLSRLAELFETGLLTEEEHALERDALIDSNGTESEPASLPITNSAVTAEGDNDSPEPDPVSPTITDIAEVIEGEDIDLLRAEVRAAEQRLAEAEENARAKQRNLERIEELEATISHIEGVLEAQNRKLDGYRAELSELRSSWDQPDDPREEPEEQAPEPSEDDQPAQIPDQTVRMPNGFESRGESYQALCEFIEKFDSSNVPSRQSNGLRSPLASEVKLWRKEYQRHLRNPPLSTENQLAWFKLLDETPGWIWWIPPHQRL